MNASSGYDRPGEPANLYGGELTSVKCSVCQKQYVNVYAY